MQNTKSEAQNKWNHALHSSIVFQPYYSSPATAVKGAEPAPASAGIIASKHSPGLVEAETNSPHTASRKDRAFATPRRPHDFKLLNFFESPHPNATNPPTRIRAQTYDRLAPPTRRKYPPVISGAHNRKKKIPPRGLSAVVLIRSLIMFETLGSSARALRPIDVRNSCTINCERPNAAKPTLCGHRCDDAL